MRQAYQNHPGEGRGPIGMAGVTDCRVLSRPSPNWAPAFAGVVAVVGIGEEAFR
jgi:hypothetical protein